VAGSFPVLYPHTKAQTRKERLKGDHKKILWPDIYYLL